MKLLLKRNTSSGMMGGTKYTLDVRADLSPEDLTIIKKNGLGSTVLVLHDKANHQSGDGAVSAVFAIMKNQILTVDSMSKGTTFKCKDVTEMLGIEAEVKDAAVQLKHVIDAARNFGGEEVIDIDELAEELA